jgi:hypothetical protein
MPGVPYTFATATTSIPLSQLDANFNTTATLGNAAVGLGNTTTTVGNLTLTNATIVNANNGSYGNVTITTIQEPANVTATAANATVNFDILSNVVQYFTSNAAGNWTVNFRGNATTTFNNAVPNNTSISATLMTTQGGTAYYNSAITIDGNSVTPKWQGGTAPTSGNASGVDSYTYVIIKTGSNAYTAFASQTQFK